MYVQYVMTDPKIFLCTYRIPQNVLIIPVAADVDGEGHDDEDADDDDDAEAQHQQPVRSPALQHSRSSTTENTGSSKPKNSGQFIVFDIVFITSAVRNPV